MRYGIWLGLLVLGTMAAQARAEEILLKDGTKIVGRMAAIKSDKIEVETAYGKMQVRRGDIRSINFPENESPTPAQQASEKKAPAPVDEALDGTRYVNRTGHFTLTVPIEWKINPGVRGNNEALAGLGDSAHFVIVGQENFSSSLEAYKGLVEIDLRKRFGDYEKVAESAVTIDGRPAVLLSYRSTAPPPVNLPIHWLGGIIRYEGEFVRITAWCVEPLFNESQHTLEKIILSYRKLRDQTSPVPGSKP